MSYVTTPLPMAVDPLVHSASLGYNKIYRMNDDAATQVEKAELPNAPTCDAPTMTRDWENTFHRSMALREIHVLHVPRACRYEMWFKESTCRFEQEMLKSVGVEENQYQEKSS